MLKSDEGKSDRFISELLYIHEDGVRNTRKRFVEDGLAAALEDKAKPQPEPKLDEQQQAHIATIGGDQFGLGSSYCSPMPRFLNPVH